MGKVTIVDFFFTECPSICPMLTSQMARLQKEFDKAGLKDKIQLLSISVKPASDTPGVLREYAQRLGADTDNWSFLTGSAEDIYPLAEKGFFLTAFPSDSAQGGVFHTDQVTLLDPEMKIRGYYEGTSTKAMDSLFSDAKYLISTLK
jgi:protein SCO1/2